MTYTEISHSQAFPFISLLSEFGGFMGLLLGASCLTLVEIFDHLVTLAWMKMMMRQMGNKQRARPQNHVGAEVWMNKQQQPEKKAKAEAWVKMQQQKNGKPNLKACLLQGQDKGGSKD